MLACCAVSLASAGCGDDPPPPPTILASCQDRWQPLTVPPAFTDDAAYVISTDVHDVDHETWSIIKIPRS
jgi:hypothetical protein